MLSSAYLFKSHPETPLQHTQNNVSLSIGASCGHQVDTSQLDTESSTITDI